jgi:hypothetical protein
VKLKLQRGVQMNKITFDGCTITPEVFTNETDEYIFAVNNKTGDVTYTDKKTGSVTEVQCGKGEPAKN